MKKNSKKSSRWGIEGKIMFVLLIAFVVVMGAAWTAANKLRDTVAANAAAMDVNPGALIEVEHMRSLADAMVADSRAYFLMGSKSIQDRQKAEKQAFADSLAKFNKEYSLPKIDEITKKIEGIAHQESDIFDQAIAFREKNTESKIVGQFYQSKTGPLLAQINSSLDEITKLHQDDLAQAKTRAHEAGLDAQAQIPKGMKWLTQALGLLFLCLSLLVVRMMRVRSNHWSERERLAEEARKAILARDEVLSAAAEDFKEPITELKAIAADMKSNHEVERTLENATAIEALAADMQSRAEDIYDQKRADMGQLTLRLDQLRVSDIMDDAQLALQPLAKQKDITLQFDNVNPSVLAYIDRERVMRVLSNLVGNAIKFSKRHSRVAIKVKSDQQFVNISVADEGPGIPDAQLGGIFESFWQSRKTKEQGAGVGLPVVKTIIDAHGGSVKAESNINGGTTFSFSLPRRRPVGAPLRKPVPTPVRRVTPSGERLDHHDGPSV